MKYNEERRLKYYEAEKILVKIGFEREAMNHRVSYSKEGFPFRCKVNLSGGPLTWYLGDIFRAVTFEDVFESFSEEEQTQLAFHLDLFR